MSSQKVQLKRIAYVSYGHPDLEEAAEFAKDFGFVEVPAPDNTTTTPSSSSSSSSSTTTTRYFRGYGDLPLSYVVSASAEPEFYGVTFEVETKQDLQLAEKIPGAGKIENMDHQPGGGMRVTIRDPENMPFNVVWGLQLIQRNEHPRVVEPFNFPAGNDDDSDKKPRRGRWQRPKRQPAPVHKLGHCGYITTDVMRSLAFYQTHFNLLKGDSIVDPTNPAREMFAFMRLDKGLHYTDHHSFFVAELGLKAAVHHAAFEVQDFDVEHTGHDYLVQKGYKPQWGIGRHGPGSQIFDYWYDRSGFVLEHYCDGDIVNIQTEFRPYEAHELNVWGPDFPKGVM
jgi:catechol 2,3-dioxygenase-like lactoylglutathione lyase family enzyme